jgi:hypothetical protein
MDVDARLVPLVDEGSGGAFRREKVDLGTGTALGTHQPVRRHHRAANSGIGTRQDVQDAHETPNR